MRVLIIGLGSIAKKHIQTLQLMYPHCQIQALRSGLKTAEGLTEGVTDIHSIDEVDDPDFIIISNPTGLHRETIERFSRLQCPLFIEKPIFDKAEKEEEELVKRLEAQRSKTYVACNLRFHPAIKFLQNYLSSSSGKVDEVNVYCGSYLPHWRPGTDFRKGYSVTPGLGGGVHLDLIHELDYIYFLFGAPHAVKSIRTNRSSLKIEAVDSARYLLDYNLFSVSLSLNYFRKETRRTIEIVRENDILLVDLLKATVTDTLTNTILFEAPHYTVSQTYRDQMEYFVNNRSAVFMNNAVEAFAILKLALS